MSDVSAVVLSMGEPSVGRALESLATQTTPPADVIVVDHISPFFRAINDGAQRVRTPFFVQVDADMILDPECIEVLRAHVRADSGIVVSALRDPLTGQTIGVKLFRTECFQRVKMNDSISPDTDFGEALQRLGWDVHYVVAANATKPRPTLGEHRPDYTPSYTYRKMLMEGARLVHRPAVHGLFSRFADLEHSRHPVAVLAAVALAHGLFLPMTRDELKPAGGDARAEWLDAFLASGRVGDSAAMDLFPLDRHSRLRDVYRQFTAAGHSLAEQNAGAAFHAIFASLETSRRDLRSTVGKVAIAHGLLGGDADRAQRTRDERLLHRFIVYGLGSRMSRQDRLRARAAHIVGLLRQAPRTDSRVRW